jgi:hypothetical protein
MLSAGAKRTIKPSYIFGGLLLCLGIVAVVLIAVTLGFVVKILNSDKVSSQYVQASPTLSEQIKVDDLLRHLEQLQVIADQSSGTRAIATSGFNNTLDYVTNQLRKNTNFIIHHQYFTVQNYVVRGTPQFLSQIAGVVSNHSYLKDFSYMIFSSRAVFDSFVQLIAIPNLGCQDSDWSSVSARNVVALVKRGNCTFPEKSIIAEKYGVRALLIYNDGTGPDRFQPTQGLRVHLNSTIPVYLLSYNMGVQLFNATVDYPLNVMVRMNIDVSDAEGIGNICADTPTGDKTKTIVVGAHSDGVPAGSGINDNGKKSAQIFGECFSLLKYTHRSHVFVF